MQHDHSSHIAVRIQNLSKTFSIKKNRPTTIRERLYSIVSSKNGRELKALRNVNFSVRKGETLGIIGGNGSGKSTLLFIILGALKADTGSKIYSKGKILRLALGMGMDKNLSARDNIYINGSLLGLSFRSIGSKFDEIVNFAGVDNFIDSPLKHFSKGMKARLNFSIAMHTDADIILLDEFFGGVGDEEFKKKSDLAFKTNILNQKTIIIVSHSLKLIRTYSDRVIWLENGEIREIGDPQLVTTNYKNSI